MLIEAQGISVAIGGRSVLDGETVRCPPGVMTALVGPSGCGKTTLLHCLGLLLPVDQGRIFDRRRRCHKLWYCSTASVLA